MSTMTDRTDKLAAGASLGLDYKAAATLTGVSEQTLRRLAAAGKLPGKFTVGRAVRFHRQALTRWLNEQAGLPADPAGTVA